jgi:hypothetical protein
VLPSVDDGRLDRDEGGLDLLAARSFVRNPSMYCIRMALASDNAFERRLSQRDHIILSNCYHKPMHPGSSGVEIARAHLP